MSLKHELDFDKKQPFKYDKLQRKDEAITLTNLVKKYDDGFVLAINNKWGAGKTTFLKMWQAYIELQEVESLYFNAWENDHQTDVLVALLSELDELKDGEKEKFKTLIEKAAPIASSVLTASIKALAKTSGADGIVQAFIDAAAEGSEKLLHTEIDNYASRKEGLKEFKKSLEDYASAIGGKNPLVFIIDELDRCRPSYAVEVLEQIKHVFSVPGIVFVLAIDKVQLGHAIKGVYGSQGMDDVEYLRRFIDVEYSMPVPDPIPYAQYLYDYFDFEKVLEYTHSSGPYEDYGKNLRSFLGHFAIYFNMNPRQLERLCAQLKIAFSVVDVLAGIIPTIYLLLAVLKMKKESLYSSIKNCEISEQDLIDELAAIIPPTISQKDQGKTIFTLSFLYNNELRYSNINHPQLLKANDILENQLCLDYKHFITDKRRDISYLQTMYNYFAPNEPRISRFIANIELSISHFNQ